jgi:hypothetical protein
MTYGGLALILTHEHGKNPQITLCEDETGQLGKLFYIAQNIGGSGIFSRVFIFIATPCIGTAEATIDNETKLTVRLPQKPSFPLDIPISRAPELLQKVISISIHEEKNYGHIDS